MEHPYDLDERVINFATLIIDLSQNLPNTMAGKHLSGQIIRSGTSPALQYGEAHAAESPDDFIHKMKVALKELRETFNALRIVKKMNWLLEEKLLPALDENNQLIAIFVTSISTARRNNRKK
jgi:four helix bundle protein